MRFFSSIRRCGEIIHKACSTQADYIRRETTITLGVTPASVDSADLGQALPAGVELCDFTLFSADLGDLFPPVQGDRIQTKAGTFKVCGRGGGTSSSFEYISSEKDRILVSTVKVSDV